MDDPEDMTQLVRAGYEHAAEAYLAWTHAHDRSRLRFLEAAFDAAERSPNALDLGCGAGVPCLRLLALRGAAIGVDIASAQLALARRNAPDALLVQADIRTVQFRLASLDLVVCLFALFHVLRGCHAEVLAHVAAWLRPDGVLLVSMGTTEGSSHEADWLGVPMLWSSFDARTNVELVRSAGLRPELIEEVPEPDGERHLWVLARRPAP